MFALSQPFLFIAPLLLFECSTFIHNASIVTRMMTAIDFLWKFLFKEAKDAKKCIQCSNQKRERNKKLITLFFRFYFRLFRIQFSCL